MGMSVDEPDPAARLQKVRATSTEVKTGPTAGLQYLMQTHVMPHLPLWVCREMVHNALATHTVVSSQGLLGWRRRGRVMSGCLGAPLLMCVCGRARRGGGSFPFLLIASMVFFWVSEGSAARSPRLVF